MNHFMLDEPFFENRDAKSNLNSLINKEYKSKFVMNLNFHTLELNLSILTLGYVVNQH